MTEHKNNLPLYAEEQFLKERSEIQEILSQFQQVVPVNFVQLQTQARNYMCSTLGWKEPICERFIFAVQGQLLQFDISQELMNELGLTEGRDITHPVYVSSEVLKRQPIQLGITIENKREIFIQKPLSVSNLKLELTNWLEELKNSRERINQLTTTEHSNQTLTQENQFLTIEIQGERQMIQRQNRIYWQKIQHLQTQLDQIRNERDALPTLPTLTDYQLLQTERDDLQITITQFQNLLGINDLNNLPVLPAGETLTSLLARPTLTQLNDLRREKDQQLTTKNTQITNLTQQVNTWKNAFPWSYGNYSLVQNKINDLKNELKKEQDWWDKWMGEDKSIFYYFNQHYDVFTIRDLCQFQPLHGLTFEFGKERFSLPIEKTREFKINMKALYLKYRDK